MPEAARRLGYTTTNSALRALQNGGVPLVRINARAWAVEETDLQEFMSQREGYTGTGRPPKKPGAAHKKDDMEPPSK